MLTIEWVQQFEGGKGTSSKLVLVDLGGTGQGDGTAVNRKASPTMKGKLCGGLYGFSFPVP